MNIVDLDNCIADDKWRLPLIHWGEHDLFKRYHNYHMAIPGDALVNRDILNNYVAIFTSRPAQYRWLTTMWLDFHKITYDFLYMRAPNDHRPSVEVKEEMLKRLVKDVTCLKIHTAYDDRQEIVEMYARHGIHAKRLAINPYEPKEWYK